MELGGKTALITGGAVRIGAAIAQALSRAGVRLAIHYRQSGAEANALCDRLRAEGREAVSVRADLQNPEATQRLIAEAISAMGPLDILINNAAIFVKDTFDALDSERLHAQFQINVFAPILLMRDFAAQGRPGAIVNLLDRRIYGLDPSSVSYELSKKTLAEATRLAARHWAPRLRVNAVAPGPTLPPPKEGPDYLREKAGAIPLGRPCAPEQIAEAVLFLLRADSITGEILTVDGGQHLVG